LGTESKGSVLTLRRTGTSRRTFAELLIDCEEDRMFRAVLGGMVREADRQRPIEKRPH
jgi:hypothetical protein